MKKEISTAPAQWGNMGWVLDERDTEGVILVVNTETKTIKALANDRCSELPEYSFEYQGTLQDLYHEGLLPGFPGQRSFVYNDDEERLSAIVNSSGVAEYCGLSEVELHLFGSLEELNAEVYGFSFANESDEPEYPMAEYNEDL